MAFLPDRNLSYKGSSEAVGDLNNGLFLGTLQLLDSYNGTIKQHLDKVVECQ